MTIRDVGWAVSKIRVDVKNSNKLFMSNWYGVSISEDGGLSWNGNNFKGTETTCVENIICDPVIKGKVYVLIADHAPEVSYDNVVTYNQLKHPFNKYTSTTALVSSKFNSEILIYAVRGDGCCILRSEDAGKTVSMSREFERGLFVQAIAEDEFIGGTFYTYLDGEICKGAGLYMSKDWGKSWNKTSLSLPSYINQLPFEKNWIESELLSVVVYQTKNVCGTNQLLCVDPHQRDTIYLGEWTEGLFKITDGGRSCINIGVGLPFKLQFRCKHCEINNFELLQF